MNYCVLLVLLFAVGTNAVFLKKIHDVVNKISGKPLVSSYVRHGPYTSQFYNYHHEDQTYYQNAGGYAPAKGLASPQPYFYGGQASFGQPLLQTPHKGVAVLHAQQAASSSDSSKSPVTQGLNSDQVIHQSKPISAGSAELDTFVPIPLDPVVSHSSAGPTPVQPPSSPHSTSGSRPSVAQHIVPEDAQESVDQYALGSQEYQPASHAESTGPVRQPVSQYAVGSQHSFASGSAPSFDQPESYDLPFDQQESYGSQQGQDSQVSSSYTHPEEQGPQDSLQTSQHTFERPSSGFQGATLPVRESVAQYAVGSAPGSGSHQGHSQPAHQDYDTGSSFVSATATSESGAPTGQNRPSVTQYAIGSQQGYAPQAVLPDQATHAGPEFHGPAQHIVETSRPVPVQTSHVSSNRPSVTSGSHGTTQPARGSVAQYVVGSQTGSLQYGQDFQTGSASTAATAGSSTSTGPVRGSVAQYAVGSQHGIDSGSAPLNAPELYDLPSSQKDSYELPNTQEILYAEPTTGSQQLNHQTSSFPVRQSVAVDSSTTQESYDLPNAQEIIFPGPTAGEPSTQSATRPAATVPLRASGPIRPSVAQYAVGSQLVSTAHTLQQGTQGSSATTTDFQGTQSNQDLYNTASAGFQASIGPVRQSVAQYAVGSQHDSVADTLSTQGSSTTTTDFHDTQSSQDFFGTASAGSQASTGPVRQSVAQYAVGSQLGSSAHAVHQGTDSLSTQGASTTTTDFRGTQSNQNLYDTASASSGPVRQSVAQYAVGSQVGSSAHAVHQGSSATATDFRGTQSNQDLYETASTGFQASTGPIRQSVAQYAVGSQHGSVADTLSTQDSSTTTTDFRGTQSNQDLYNTASAGFQASTGPVRQSVAQYAVGSQIHQNHHSSGQHYDLHTQRLSAEMTGSQATTVPARQSAQYAVGSQHGSIAVHQGSDTLSTQGSSTTTTDFRGTQSNQDLYNTASAGLQSVDQYAVGSQHGSTAHTVQQQGSDTLSTEGSSTTTTDFRGTQSNQHLHDTASTGFQASTGPIRQSVAQYAVGSQHGSVADTLSTQGSSTTTTDFQGTQSNQDLYDTTSAGSQASTGPVRPSVAQYAVGSQIIQNQQSSSAGAQRVIFPGPSSDKTGSQYAVGSELGSVAETVQQSTDALSTQGSSTTATGFRGTISAGFQASTGPVRQSVAQYAVGSQLNQQSSSGQHYELNTGSQATTTPIRQSAQYAGSIAETVPSSRQPAAGSVAQYVVGSQHSTQQDTQTSQQGIQSNQDLSSTGFQATTGPISQSVAQYAVGSQFASAQNLQSSGTSFQGTQSNQDIRGTSSQGSTATGFQATTGPVRQSVAQYAVDSDSSATGATSGFHYTQTNQNIRGSSQESSSQGSYATGTQAARSPVRQSVAQYAVGSQGDASAHTIQSNFQSSAASGPVHSDSTASTTHITGFQSAQSNQNVRGSSQGSSGFQGAAQTIEQGASAQATTQSGQDFHATGPVRQSVPETTDILSAGGSLSTSGFHASVGASAYTAQSNLNTGSATQSNQNVHGSSSQESLASAVAGSDASSQLSSSGTLSSAPIQASSGPIRQSIAQYAVGSQLDTSAQTIQQQQGSTGLHAAQSGHDFRGTASQGSFGSATSGFQASAGPIRQSVAQYAVGSQVDSSAHTIQSNLQASAAQSAQSSHRGSSSEESLASTTSGFQSAQTVHSNSQEAKATGLHAAQSTSQSFGSTATGPVRQSVAQYAVDSPLGSDAKAVQSIPQNTNILLAGGSSATSGFQASAGPIRQSVAQYAVGSQLDSSAHTIQSTLQEANVAQSAQSSHRGEESLSSTTSGFQAAHVPVRQSVAQYAVGSQLDSSAHSNLQESQATGPVRQSVSQYAVGSQLSESVQSIPQNTNILSASGSSATSGFQASAGPIRQSAQYALGANSLSAQDSSATSHAFQGTSSSGQNQHDASVQLSTSGFQSSGPARQSIAQYAVESQSSQKKNLGNDSSGASRFQTAASSTSTGHSSSSSFRLQSSQTRPADGGATIVKSIYSADTHRV